MKRDITPPRYVLCDSPYLNENYTLYPYRSNYFIDFNILNIVFFK